MSNNIKIIVIVICTILSVFLLTQCLRMSYKITDWYVVDPEGDRISPYDDFGTKGYHLWCNPNCGYDVKIDNVKSIKWDKKHIIVEQQENEQINWYLIIASGEELRCCNRDTTISFNSKLELDRLIQKKNINVKKMKEKHFK